MFKNIINETSYNLGDTVEMQLLVDKVSHVKVDEENSLYYK